MTEFEIKELYFDTDGMKRLVLETYEPISSYDYQKMLNNHIVNVMPTYFLEDFVDDKHSVLRDINNNPKYIPKFGNPCLPPKFTRSYLTQFFVDDIAGVIEKVIFNKPATIILWANGDKTVVKCSKDDTYDPEIGFAMAVLKHDRPDFKKLFKKYYKEGINNE